MYRYLENNDKTFIIKAKFYLTSCRLFAFTVFEVQNVPE